MMAGRMLSYAETHLNGAFPQAGSVRGSNFGLVFDRYLPIWSVDRSSAPSNARPLMTVQRQKDTQLLDSLQEFCRDVNRTKSEIDACLDLSHNRWKVLEQPNMHPALRVEARDFILSSRMVLGTGAEHPLENALTFEPTLGMPYVPGSALKGLCRAVSEGMNIQQEVRLTLLGHDAESARSGTENETAGDIVFYSAFPRSCPLLTVDIINPHHSQYYQDDRREIEPVDYESPVPVYLLAVQPGVRFCFRISSRSGNRALRSLAMEVLTIGLTQLGTGSKTAVGYGRWNLEP